jgi:hypothetical protein
MRATEFIIERKKSRKKSRKIRRVSGYYFPGYGYYGGGGDSGEGGGDGGGGESRSNMAEEAKTVKYNGLILKYAFNDSALIMKAFEQGSPIAYVKFVREGKELYPQDLWVNDDYRNKGIAKSMYDYLKSAGYIINRSHDQTKAGTGFWDKHRGEDEYVWED